MSTQPTSQLDIEVADGVCRITFRRPEAFNALSEEMATGLVRQLHAAAADDAVRVVVVTGSGGSFSAGADLTGENPVEHFDERTMDGANAIARAIVGLGKPVVAAVNGIAAGVGASICFAADLAVATESAAFLLAFSRVGLMPDGGSSLTVAASVGRARAMRMALLAEPLPAREAYDAGLVSHVVPDEEFAETVDRLVRRLAAGPPLALAATKKAVNAATLTELEAALERERRGQVVLFGTEDAAEGMRAFVEKRRPAFRGA
jgi:enoyl-CoA hydratase